MNFRDDGADITSGLICQCNQNLLYHLIHIYGNQTLCVILQGSTFKLEICILYSAYLCAESRREEIEDVFSWQTRSQNLPRTRLNLYSTHWCTDFKKGSQDIWWADNETRCFHGDVSDVSGYLDHKGAQNNMSMGGISRMVIDPFQIDLMVDSNIIHRVSYFNCLYINLWMLRWILWYIGTIGSQSLIFAR